MSKHTRGIDRHLQHTLPGAETNASILHVGLHIIYVYCLHSLLFPAARGCFEPHRFVDVRSVDDTQCQRYTIARVLYTESAAIGIVESILHDSEIRVVNR